VLFHTLFSLRRETDSVSETFEFLIFLQHSRWVSRMISNLDENVCLQSTLPSYEEAVWERCIVGVGPLPGGMLPHRSHRGPHWTALGSGGRRPRGDTAYVTRQSSR
jgi:hypothetical protein